MLTPLLVAAAVAVGPPPVRIAAAANLSGALDEVARAFAATCPERCPTKISYGASGTLAAQIENGAPFDLFLAADSVYPQKVAEAGFSDGAPFIYTRGKLALWVPAESKLPIEREGLAALGDPSVQRIAIGNPVLAPYGKLALEALKAAGQDDPKRLVMGESVGQAAQQAQSGSVQAALLPLSLVLQMPGRHVETEAKLDQGGVVLKPARERPLARAFVDFLLSVEARKIFARHGYAP
jgi:molybdate transport system substrate-binding protein